MGITIDMIRAHVRAGFQAVPSDGSAPDYGSVEDAIVNQIEAMIRAQKPEDWSHAEMSFGEHRASKSHACKDWSPRDALVHTLRAIDDGRLKIGSVFIAWSKHDDDGGLSVGYAISAETLISAVGLATRALFVAQNR